MSGAADSLARRWLSLAGGDPQHAAGARLRVFRRFLLFYGAVRSWLWWAWSPSDHGLLAACALVMSASAALAWSRRHEALAPWLALAPLLVQLGWRFVSSANHLYLELLCVALLCVADRRARPDRALALHGLRWLTVIVLFHTGLQKLLYGHYFHGDFLAFMVGTQDRFARLFQLLLPAAEVARLQSLDPWQTGAGPYRTGHLPFVLASNAVVLAELVLPALLLLPRTRLWGAACAMALMASIQLGALELGFAFLFLNLLLLFAPPRWASLVLPIFAATLLYALGAAAGWLPGSPHDWNLL